jgi:hypothetical protein
MAAISLLGFPTRLWERRLTILLLPQTIQRLNVSP